MNVRLNNRTNVRTNTKNKQRKGFKKINTLIKQRENIILKGGDLLSQKGFTQVPNHILESKKLSPGSKLAYAMLLKYAWQNDFCFPGQKKLAVDKDANVFPSDI